MRLYEFALTRATVSIALAVASTPTQANRQAHFETTGPEIWYIDNYTLGDEFRVKWTPEASMRAASGAPK